MKSLRTLRGNIAEWRYIPIYSEPRQPMEVSSCTPQLYLQGKIPHCSLIMRLSTHRGEYWHFGEKRTASFLPRFDALFLFPVRRLVVIRTALCGLLFEGNLDVILVLLRDLKRDILAEVLIDFGGWISNIRIHIWEDSGILWYRLTLL